MRHATSRLLRWTAALVLTLGGLAAGCGDETQPVTFGCVDRDGDGYGLNCQAGLDCDDSDAERFATASAFPDLDGDGVTAGGPLQVCAGEALPTGFVASANGDDCDDADAEAFQSALGYVDADGDAVGFGSPLIVCAGESLPTEFAEAGGDCDDGDGDVFQLLLGFADGDGDGVGAGAPLLLCSGADLPSGFVAQTGDCDDTDPEATTECIECVDVDGDGYGVGCPAGSDCDDGDAAAFRDALLYVDDDGDGVGATAVTHCIGEDVPEGFLSESGGTDCDDSDGDVYQQVLAYPDADSDGTGQDNAVLVCSGEELPEAFSDTPGDCDDDDGDNTESCDSCVDGDEDGYFIGCDTYAVRLGPDCNDRDPFGHQLAAIYPDRDEDGYTYGDAVTLCIGDETPEGYRTDATEDDCDDLDPAVYRRLDLYTDHDGDGVTLFGDGVETCVGDEIPEWLAEAASDEADCDDANSEVYQWLGGYPDFDLDGFTVGTEAVDVCAGDSLPDRYLASASGDADCDDLDPTVNPDAEEILGDGVDQDCTAGDPLPTSDDDGVFVAVDAVVGGTRDGSLSAPYATIEEGVDRAVELGRDNVYVAGGSYSENVETTVSILGGYTDDFSVFDPGSQHVWIDLDDLNAPAVRVPAGADVTLANLSFAEEEEIGFTLLENAGTLTLRATTFSGDSLSPVTAVRNLEGGTLAAFDVDVDDLDSEDVVTGIDNAGTASLVRALLTDLDSGAGITAVKSDGALTIIDSTFSDLSLGSVGVLSVVDSGGSTVLRDVDIELLTGCVADDLYGLRLTEQALVENTTLDIACDASIVGIDVAGEASLWNIQVELEGQESVGMRIGGDSAVVRYGWVISYVWEKAEGIHVIDEADAWISDLRIVGTVEHQEKGVTKAVPGVADGVVIEEGASAWLTDSLIAGSADGASNNVSIGVLNKGQATIVSCVLGGALHATTEQSIAVSNLGEMWLSDSELCRGAGYFESSGVINSGQLAMVDTVMPGSVCSDYTEGTLTSVRSGGDEAVLRLRGNTFVDGAVTYPGATVIGVEVANPAWLTDNVIDAGERADVLDSFGIRLEDGADVALLETVVDAGEAGDESIGLDAWGDTSAVSAVIEMSELSGGIAGEASYGLRARGELVLRDSAIEGGDVDVGNSCGAQLSGGFFLLERNDVASGRVDDGVTVAVEARDGANALLLDNVLAAGGSPAGEADSGALVVLDGAVAHAVNNTLYAGFVDEPIEVGAVGVYHEGNAFDFPNLVLVNNVIHAGESGHPDWGPIGLVTLAERPGVRLRNNLFYGEGLQAVVYDFTLDQAIGTGALVDRCEWLACARSAGSSVGDPQLADPEAGDFSLLETSPAIDAGVDPVPLGYGFWVDHDLVQRPQSGGYDLGAFEY